MTLPDTNKRPKLPLARPRGTRDFLPDQMEQRRFVERQLRHVAERWSYREIATPAFEPLDLFTIKSGEAIQEEIYSFSDRGGRALALRPELTAPVMRMYVNELQSAPKPLKYYYFGDCFRYERPQSGRYRQFWQFGVELIGSALPEADAEVIALSQHMLHSVKLDIDIHLSSLDVLRAVFCDVDKETCALAMRLIDKGDFSHLQELPHGSTAIDIIKAEDPLSEAQNLVTLDHMLRVLELLDMLAISYTVDFSIARGLEYYTGIVFEAYAHGLGAQDQVLGGGSYRLAALFGGTDVPATGFGIGFDRVMEAAKPSVTLPLRVLVVTTEDARSFALHVVNELRTSLTADLDVMGRNLRAQLTYANSAGFDYAVIIGKKEMDTLNLTLRNLKTGEQELLRLDEIIARIGVGEGNRSLEA
ncbi:MAG: histidine--tRNA ligase [Halobacteriota archaeon]